MNGQNKARVYGFHDRLVVKLLGRAEWITRFIYDVQKLYPAERMNFSPILKNKDADGYHCFINLIMDKPSPNEEVDE